MSNFLPKYTVGTIIAALRTLKTTEELDKFWASIRDNHHLSKEYRKNVKRQYERRRTLLAHTEEVEKLGRKLRPANESTEQQST